MGGRKTIDVFRRRNNRCRINDMEELNKIPENREETRNPDGTYKPGVSGNPGGRPKNTLKGYLARKFDKMTDEEKEAWLIANKVSAEVQWKMAEGNPRQDTDVSFNKSIAEVLDELEHAGSETG